MIELFHEVVSCSEVCISHGNAITILSKWSLYSFGESFDVPLCSIELII
jgi:hypothetical protein